MRFRRRQKGQDPDRKYAAEQFKLGFHYHHLSTGDGAANLARAIGCYTEALRFHTAEAAPSQYAMTVNNPGNAYAELPTWDRAANLARAIECFTQALRFFTAEAAPAEYAGVQQSLGDAYAKLLKGERMGNLTRKLGPAGRAAADRGRCGGEGWGGGWVVRRVAGVPGRRLRESAGQGSVSGGPVRRPPLGCLAGDCPAGG